MLCINDSALVSAYSNVMVSNKRKREDIGLLSDSRGVLSRDFLPLLKVNLDDRPFKRIHKNEYGRELARLVLISEDFVGLEEIHVCDDVIMVTAKKALSAAFFSNFFRGVKEDRAYTTYYFVKPTVIEFNPCYEILHCKNNQCHMRHYEEVTLCFRFKEMQMCDANCRDCKFFEMRFSQVLASIDETRYMLYDEEGKKGMCGRQMCREARLKGCPNGCTTM